MHLLLTPAEPDGVSRLMKNLGQRYVQYVNRRHGRTGTLWEGRFHSCIVQAEAYLLACQRYIELNPVRAGMVRDPADYRWSSYAANALGAQDDLVKPHETMLALSANEQRRMQAYRSLFDLAGIADHDVRIRTAMHALGDELFQRVVLATAGRRI
ncbi:MAG: transposase [Burkholderiales bacterium]